MLPQKLLVNNLVMPEGPDMASGFKFVANWGQTTFLEMSHELEYYLGRNQKIVLGIEHEEGNIDGERVAKKS